MREADYEAFVSTLAAIGDMKGKPVSPVSLAVWWKALAAYDYEAVEDALIRHVQNPDNGQFMPAPADVIKLIDGNTLDAALVAWAKLDKAVRSVGTWEDVVFDDPVIHSVVSDMGGWAGFGEKSDDDWPHVGREFQNRYRGYRTRADGLQYPPVLGGSFNMSNGLALMRQTPPRLIGDPARATRVMHGGSLTQKIGIHVAGPAVLAALPAPPSTTQSVVPLLQLDHKEHQA